MCSQLRSYVTQLAPLSASELTYLENQCVYREVPKRFLLIEEGTVAQEVYFINQGCLRLFYPREGEEITAFIFLENLFATSLESLLQQTPSQQCLETLEDSELLVISYENLMKVYNYSVNFQIMARRITEQRFINAQRILSSHILDSPEERYQKLLATQPAWFQRVPQHYIASFLGITPVSLSRIRKRMSEK
ncbi:Crp/Fnr family transcriptional regulator [Tunicatimonas pelagia]|uniref:Crp/Fnr family transcriptional regulator n=1 Tax=Tunicatimonas pelagia TaxID=931531 RepID=UPI002666BC73|nr:Crp/Fnr family transcriptional regulator [Tunicatimonas pelagia]WKN40767.1 Crp/Fnr family transcriptional regulator [Tunicatimonas pelagia]